MAKLFTWATAASGDFDEVSNWNQHPDNGIVGVPGPDDAAAFNTGGAAYDVTLSGKTVGSITASDFVTFIGSMTATRGIGGSTMTLMKGTVHTDFGQGGSVSADYLTVKNETITGGGVGGLSRLTATNSTFDLDSSLTGYGTIKLSNIFAEVHYFGMVGSGKILGSDINSSKGGSLNDAGAAEIAGNIKLDSTTLTAARLDLIGTIDWNSGDIEAQAFSAGKDQDSQGLITFTGTQLTTKSFDDPDGSASPADIRLIGAHWSNSGAYTSSGTLALSAGASLTTGSFAANPERGNGAVVTVSGSKLTVNGPFNVQSATVTGGGHLDVDGDAKLNMEAGVVFNGDFDISGDLLGSGKQTIGAHGLVSLGGTDTNVIIAFDPDGSDESLILGKHGSIEAQIVGFHAGAVIKFSGFDKHAKFTTHADGADTEVTFKSGGKTIGNIVLDGHYKASDLHFNAKHHTLTSTVAIAGTGESDKINGTIGDDTLDGQAGNDKVVGGAGRDHFIFKTGYGNDTIADFDANGSNHDVLDLRGLKSISDFDDLKRHMSTSNADVVIVAGHGDMVTLTHVAIGDLTHADFLV
jgi:hypothetical protein